MAVAIADYPGNGFLAERSVDIGQTITYDNVPSGPIEIWEDDVNSPWGYWDTALIVCDTLKFNVYPYPVALIQESIKFDPLIIKNDLVSDDNFRKSLY